MSYSSVLCTLLSLPSFSLSLKEAQAKLSDTFLLLNGQLVYVKSFSEVGIIYFIEETEFFHSGEGVKSLDVWLPDTGVYSSNDGKYKVFLQRMAYRQWKKSFSPSFYTVFCMEKKFSLFNISPHSRVDFWISKSNCLHYHNRPIGEIRGKTITCNNRIFTQEIKDWMKTPLFLEQIKEKDMKDDIPF